MKTFFHTNKIIFILFTIIITLITIVTFVFYKLKHNNQQLLSAQNTQYNKFLLKNYNFTLSDNYNLDCLDDTIPLDVRYSWTLNCKAVTPNQDSIFLTTLKSNKLKGDFLKEIAGKYIYDNNLIEDKTKTFKIRCQKEKEDIYTDQKGGCYFSLEGKVYYLSSYFFNYNKDLNTINALVVISRDNSKAKFILENYIKDIKINNNLFSIRLRTINIFDKANAQDVNPPTSILDTQDPYFVDGETNILTCCNMNASNINLGVSNPGEHICWDGEVVSDIQSCSAETIICPSGVLFSYYPDRGQDVPNCPPVVNVQIFVE